MNLVENKIVHLLTGKPSLQEVSVSELEAITQEQPFFSVAQLLLAKKMKLEHHPGFAQQVAKTALFFPNTYWLDHQLNNDSSVEQPQAAASYVSYTPAADTGQPAAEESPVVSETETETTAAPISHWQPAVEEQVTAAVTDTDTHPGPIVTAEPEPEPDIPTAQPDTTEEPVAGTPTDSTAETPATNTTAEETSNWRLPVGDLYEEEEAGGSQQSAVSSQEDIADTEPVTSDEQPTTNNEQPATNNQHPTEHIPEPIPQPAEPVEEEALGNEEPVVSQEEENIADTEPVTSNGQPTTNNEQPATNNQHPTEQAPSWYFDEEPAPATEDAGANEQSAESSQEADAGDQQPAHIPEPVPQPAEPVEEEAISATVEAVGSQDEADQQPATDNPQPVTGNRQLATPSDPLSETALDEVAEESEAYEQSIKSSFRATDPEIPPAQDEDQLPVNEIGETGDGGISNRKLAELLEQQARVYNQPVDASSELPIETDSYHTVDYFASQGIKMEIEPLESDAFGKKVRKFTDWLKQMKKINPQPSDLGTTNELEQAVKGSAAHSNETKDIVTEAMAEVLVKQGKIDKAIQVYSKLSFLNPDKSAYFAAKILALKAT